MFLQGVHVIVDRHRPFNIQCLVTVRSVAWVDKERQSACHCHIDHPLQIPHRKQSSTTLNVCLVCTLKSQSLPLPCTFQPMTMTLFTVNHSTSVVFSPWPWPCSQPMAFALYVSANEHGPVHSPWPWPYTPQAMTMTRFTAHDSAPVLFSQWPWPFSQPMPLPL